eukprot:jgi/Phyca11/124703/e_gw1.54.135.1
MSYAVQYSIELYCGRENTTDAIPKAVIRNLSKALQGQPGKRLIVTDNFYTCVKLSERLLRMGYYSVGTTRVNRKGWNKSIQLQSKSTMRGTYRIAQNRQIPELIAVSWKDSSIVNFLATGVSTKRVLMQRRWKPDVHGYIVHKIVIKEQNKKVPTHAEYMERLHRELLGQQKKDFEVDLQGQNLLTRPVPNVPHALTEEQAKYDDSKTREYLCKVCSALSDKQHRSSESRFYCEQCSATFSGRVQLCNTIRRPDEGNTLTCWQIWHETWKNGWTIPPALRRKIRFRPLHKNSNQ